MELMGAMLLFGASFCEFSPKSSENGGGVGSVFFHPKTCAALRAPSLSSIMGIGVSSIVAWVVISEVQEGVPIQGFGVTGCRFIRKALGGPTLAEYEHLMKEKNDLVAKYDSLVIEHEECCRKLLELLPPPEASPDGGPSADSSGTSPPTLLPCPPPPVKPLLGPTPTNSKAPAAPPPAVTEEKSKSPSAKK